MDIGRKLRETRIALGLTQKEMVLGTNLTAKHYSKIEKGNNNISVNDLLDILFLRNIDINIFFEKNVSSKDVDRELNETFYDRDLNRALVLRDKILENPSSTAEQRDRAILTVDVLKGKDKSLAPETKDKILHDFLLYEDWLTNIDALRLLANIIREDNVKDFTSAVKRLIRRANNKKLNRHQEELIATICVNYIFNAKKIKYNNVIIDELILWIKKLPAIPNFALYKILGNYFDSLSKNNNVENIISILNEAGYKAITEKLPR